jgi:hypothetical protein
VQHAIVDLIVPSVVQVGQSYEAVTRVTNISPFYTVFTVTLYKNGVVVSVETQYILANYTGEFVTQMPLKENSNDTITAYVEVFMFDTWRAAGQDTETVLPASIGTKTGVIVGVFGSKAPQGNHLALPINTANDGHSLEMTADFKSTGAESRGNWCSLVSGAPFTGVHLREYTMRHTILNSTMGV